MTYTYEYPRPALTVDCVILGWDNRELQVLLIERGQAPFAGQWALPGGFVRMEESLDAAALRELQEETGVSDVFLEQLYTWGAPERDPRGRVVSVAYYALIHLDGQRLQADTDAAEARWFPVNQVPALAFDHSAIFTQALERLRGKVRYRPVGFELLPPKFTLSQLQRLYEGILGMPLDKRNFRKKILSMGLLKDLGERETGVARRAGALYAFDEAAYKRLEQNGFQFAL